MYNFTLAQRCQDLSIVKEQNDKYQHILLKDDLRLI